MKFTIARLVVTFRARNLVRLEIECKGSGTEEDPLIIEPSESLPDSFHIIRSHLFVIVKNCKRDFISLNSCTNITITKCNFKNCVIKNCNDINIKDTSISNNLKIYDCMDIKIEDSIIKNLKCKRSNSTNIRNCTIGKIRGVRSEGIAFGAFKP